MNLIHKLSDLRFVIGLFLVIIGVLVLGTYFFPSNAETKGIQVNLLGGAMLAVTGGVLLFTSRFKEE